MNSREFFVSTLQSQQKGKVPLCLRDLTLGLDALGVRTDAVFGETYDSKLSAECVLALQKMMGNDVIMGCISTYSLEAFGGETKYPSDGIPYLTGYPFADVENIDRMSPSDVDGKILRGMRGACEIVSQKRPDLALMVNVPGPMTMAGFFRGLETLMMDLISSPELSKKILDFSTEVIAEEMRLLYDGIGDAVFFASASDNPDMVGDEDYLKYSVANIRSLVSKAHSDGVLTVYHPHGVFSTDDRRKLLDASVGTGTDGFQFAEGNETSGIAEGCAGRCCILGGVDAFSTLLLGPDRRIVRDTERFLGELSQYGYIMTCSCSVNRGLPLNNLKVMADRVHAFNGAME